MIGYGIAIESDLIFDTHARPGLRECADPAAPVAEARDNPSIWVGYNSILDHFEATPDLEALVLLRENVKLQDRQLETKIRTVMSDDGVAIIRSPNDGLMGSADCHLIVLSAWAVRNLRFDPDAPQNELGYDDLCRKARSQGRTVRAVDVSLSYTELPVNRRLESTQLGDRMLQESDQAPKLNLGCGTDYKLGWVNIDNNSDGNISRLDLHWDLSKPLPYPDNSVAYIFNEHLLEHLSVSESRAAITDFLRILKPGGVLRIAMPDLAVAVHNYLHLDIQDDRAMQRFRMDFVKTRAERLNMAFRFWGHQWLYDWEELERRLNECGCPSSAISKCSHGESEHPALRNLETRPESVLIAEVTK